MEKIELTHNSRTGGYDLYAIRESLKLRGVEFTFQRNARSEGYGTADVLEVNPNGQEELLEDFEWRLLAKGYTAEPPDSPYLKRNKVNTEKSA